MSDPLKSLQYKYSNWSDVSKAAALYKKLVGDQVYRAKTREDIFQVCLVLVADNVEIGDIRYTVEIHQQAHSYLFPRGNLIQGLERILPDLEYIDFTTLCRSTS